MPDYPTIERGLDWLLDQEILTERQVNRLAGDLGTRVAIETATLHSAFDDLLRGQLAESFARSEGRDAWRDRLSKTLPGLLNHAEAIGRTYSHRAYQQGLDEVLSESKVASDEFPYDLYQATGDSRTRETHRELDDKVAHRGSPLANLMRERHAEWGCRCTIVPISREEALARGIDDDTGWVAEDMQTDQEHLADQGKFSKDFDDDDKDVVVNETKIKSLEDFDSLKRLLKSKVLDTNLSQDSILLWHGTSSSAAQKIAKQGRLKSNDRGNNATIDIDHAGEYPESTGADALVLIRAKTKSLKPDLNDAPEEITSLYESGDVAGAVKSSLFPKNKTNRSSVEIGDHEILAIFDVRGTSNSGVDRTKAFDALKRGDLLEAIYAGSDLKFYDKSKFSENKVTVDLSHIQYKRSEIVDTLKRVDASLSIDDLPGLVGAPDGSRVNLSIPASNEIKINLYDPETGYKSRRVLKTYNDKLILKNEESELPKAKQGKGISTDIFAKQVKAAEAAGVDEIWAVAAKADDLNGYYTWARLGFDSPLSPRFKATLPPEFASAETVQDLMATEAGRDYWRANGYQTGMIFSVKPGSRNREIFERYLRSKGRQV